MNLQSAMKELRACGAEQNRKVYARHGVRGNAFGVSYANQRALAKKIKRDHALAQQLWETGNHDARVLATMIADPQAASAAELDAWANDLDSYVLSDALSAFAAQTPLASRKTEQWGKSREEYVAAAGWNVVAWRAQSAPEAPDSDFEGQIATIERKIHKAANRVRQAMNAALCAIGIGRPGLRDAAIAAARRIGKVEVDHGETGCKTPEAAAYIEQAVRKLAARAGAKRKTG